jgi:hypothetical protein
MKRILNKNQLVSGLLAGFLATFIFVGANALLRGATGASPAVTALYGLPSTLAATMIVHFLNGSLMGGFYALIIENLPRKPSYIEEVVVEGGIGYGVFTTVFFASIVMPVWLYSVGFSDSISILNIKPMSLVTHILYGAGVAAAYRPLKSFLSTKI